MNCPKNNCGGELVEVYFGDGVRRWRCLKCDIIFSEKEFALGHEELINAG
ncbi:MAG: hypothetical protein ACYCX4_14800 [Bacillota bacterium]